MILLVIVKKIMKHLFRENINIIDHQPIKL